VKRRVVLDTGPLVAFLDRRDRFHGWSVAQWGEVEPPLFTCESVLSEACYLLASSGLESASVPELVARGVVALTYRVDGDAELLAKLMKKYARVPMSLADACLVRMIEGLPQSEIMTLDSDFRIYRKHGRRIIRAIMPG